MTAFTPASMGLLLLLWWRLAEVRVKIAAVGAVPPLVSLWASLAGGVQAPGAGALGIIAANGGCTRATEGPCLGRHSRGAAQSKIEIVAAGVPRPLVTLLELPAVVAQEKLPGP